MGDDKGRLTSGKGIEGKSLENNSVPKSTSTPLVTTDILPKSSQLAAPATTPTTTTLPSAASPPTIPQINDSQLQQELDSLFFERYEAKSEYIYELFFRRYDFIVLFLRKQIEQARLDLYFEQFDNNTRIKGDKQKYEKLEFDIVGYIYSMIISVETLLKNLRFSGDNPLPPAIASASVRKAPIDVIERCLNKANILIKLVILFDAVAKALLDAVLTAAGGPYAPIRIRLQNQLIDVTQCYLDTTREEKPLPVLLETAEKLQKDIIALVTAYSYASAKAKIVSNKMIIILSIIQAGEGVLNITRTALPALDKVLGSGGGLEGIKLALGPGGCLVAVTNTTSSVIVDTLAAKQLGILIATEALPIASGVMMQVGLRADKVPSAIMIQGAKMGWTSSKAYGKPRFFRLTKGAYYKTNRVKHSFEYKEGVRYDSGFEKVKKEFLLKLADDPEVQAVFKQRPDLLAMLKAGQVPTGYEVHHIIPATAKVKGIVTNAHSNLSLMPRWLHIEVTTEWSNAVSKLSGKGVIVGEFDFPTFSRFVHTSDPFILVKNLMNIK